jgi:peptidoglycan/xylan/chitin deacetylase (PgdA/CDA1 family)
VKAILTYHSIDSTGSAISVSPEVWAAHARWLSNRHVRVLDLDDLIAHPVDGPDAVAVTFDDGFLNVRGAMELLRSSGVPVTVFVVTSHVGGTNAWGGRAAPGIPTLPLLDWADLESLAAQGVSIQAHSRTHPTLTTRSATELDDELLGCREDLAVRLGVRPRHLAYPYGDVNDAVVMRAAQWYAGGHTTDFRGIATDDHAMRLPRLDMYYFDAPGRLEAWGQGAFQRRIAWIRARRALRGLLHR